MREKEERFPPPARGGSAGGGVSTEAPGESGTGSWHLSLRSQRPAGQPGVLPLPFALLSAVLPWGNRGEQWGLCLWHIDPENEHCKASYQGLQTLGE